MNIILCRHGDRTPYGSDKINPPVLTNNGIAQMRNIAKWSYQSHKIEGIYSSPKVRCIQSAMPTSEICNLPIHVLPFLIEHDSYGPLDYDSNLIAEYGSILDSTEYLDNIPIREEKPFAYIRSQIALGLFRSRHEDQTIIIFAHDCFNSIFIWAWQGLGCLTEEDRYYQNCGHVNLLFDGSPPIINMMIPT